MIHFRCNCTNKYSTTRTTRRSWRNGKWWHIREVGADYDTLGIQVSDEKWAIHYSIHEQAITQNKKRITNLIHPTFQTLRMKHVTTWSDHNLFRTWILFKGTIADGTRVFIIAEFDISVDREISTQTRSVYEVKWRNTEIKDHKNDWPIGLIQAMIIVLFR